MKRYELSFQKNIRDLGGLKTVDGRFLKEGRLFRGGALARVNEDDVKVIDSFHLTDIVDFRGEEEFLHRPDHLFDGVEYHNFPIIEEKVKDPKRNDDGNLLWFLEEGASGAKHLLDCYQEFILSPKAIAGYHKFFELLLNEGRTVYFHCSQGKDRAGFAAYLLEIALGVPEEKAREDYLLTNLAMKEKIASLTKRVENKPFFNERFRQDLIDVFSAKEEYLDESIRLMNERYGGTMNYIQKAVGVDVERLKELYLE